MVGLVEMSPGTSGRWTCGFYGLPRQEAKLEDTAGTAFASDIFIIVN